MEGRPFWVPRAGTGKVSQKPAVRDNRGTPLTLTLSPASGERGFFGSLSLWAYALTSWMASRDFSQLT